MPEPSDSELLTRYASHGDDEVFAAVVRRHAAMVHAVCRRVLADHGAAEDVAQAVFLTLASKAASVARRPQAGGWLHTVARRLALDARRSRQRRQQREELTMRDVAPHTPAAVEHSALCAELDQALGELPERYRLPLILFHLEEHSLEETAAALSLNPQTAGTRLARGRALLRARLLRRGVAVASVGAVTSALAAETGAAILPPTFVSATVKAAGLAAAGKLAAGVSAGTISPAVAALTEGALKMMFWNRVKTAAALAAASVLVVVSGLLVAQELAAPAKATPPAAVAAAGTGTAQTPPAQILRGTAENDADTLGWRGTEARTAVDAALRWLALHQEADGRWEAKRWDTDDVPAPATGAGSGAPNDPSQVNEYDTGITGLATLALLGGGHTLSQGEHRLATVRAINWLIGRQDAKTGYVSQKTYGAYQHAIATIALCEAFGRSPDEQVGQAARRAVEGCVKAAAKDGGWRYTPKPPSSDASVTSWFLQALNTARLANIKFDHAAFAKGLAYFDQCTDRGAMAGSSGAVGYEYAPSFEYGEGSPALTCAGMVIRQFNGMGVNHPVLVRAAELTKRRPPNWDGGKDFYYWYYATYAMHNMGGESRLWWNRRIRDTLLDHQARKGHQAGSWHPEHEKWNGGRVYCTALGALCLEVYYRYNEALQSVGSAPAPAPKDLPPSGAAAVK